METTKYKVTKKFGQYRIGDIVTNKTRYIRRKIEEGGCLVKISDKIDLGKNDKDDKQAEKKSVKSDNSLKNKMDNNYSNKGGGK